jgi:hypothetical protein
LAAAPRPPQQVVYLLGVDVRASRFSVTEHAYSTIPSARQLPAPTRHVEQCLGKARA